MTDQITQTAIATVNRGTPEYWESTKAAFAAIRYFDRLVKEMKSAAQYCHSGSYDENGDPIPEENVLPFLKVQDWATDLLAHDRTVEILEAQGRIEEVKCATQCF